MPGSVDDEIRVLRPERLCDVSAQAYGLVRLEHLGELLGTDGVPLNGDSGLVDQGGPAVVPVQLSDRLATQHAVLPRVPPPDEQRHQASVRGVLDLRQALLSAPFTLGPAAAVLEPRRGRDRKSVVSRTSGQ